MDIQVTNLLGNMTIQAADSVDGGSSESPRRRSSSLTQLIPTNTHVDPHQLDIHTEVIATAAFFELSDDPYEDPEIRRLLIETADPIHVSNGEWQNKSKSDFLAVKDQEKEVASATQ